MPKYSDNKCLRSNVPTHFAVEGKWTATQSQKDIINPWNGEVMLRIPDTQQSEIEPFVRSLKRCPKTGLHNPWKNPER